MYYNNYCFDLTSHTHTHTQLHIINTYIRYRPDFKGAKPVSSEGGRPVPLQTKNAKSKKFNLTYSVSFESTGKLRTFVDCTFVDCVCCELIECVCCCG